MRFSLADCLIEFDDETLVDFLLVLEKGELFGKDTLFLRHETTELKVVADDEHDESANRAIAIITRGINLRLASEMLDQTLGLQQNLGIFGVEAS